MLCSHLLLHNPCYDYAHTQLIFCHRHACGAEGSELQHTDTLLQDRDSELHLIHKAVLQDWPEREVAAVRSLSSCQQRHEPQGCFQQGPSPCQQHPAQQ